LGKVKDSLQIIHFQRAEYKIKFSKEDGQKKEPVPFDDIDILSPLINSTKIKDVHLKTTQKSLCGTLYPSIL
jgi:hypothetical protein